MSRKPTTQTNPGLVDRHINTAFDEVKVVADNIETVISLSEAIEGGGLVDVIDNLPILLAAVPAAEEAAVSASAANVSKLAAGVSEVNAKASETASKASETFAGTSASSAVVSAATATTKASEALASANAASASETVALAQAAIATTKATEASASATSTSTSATTATAQAIIATDKATVATTQAGIATTKATEAAASASTAQGIAAGLPAAANTEIARVVATGTTEVGKVNTAGTAQVALATAQAVLAANSATASATSAANANTSKVAAGTSETNALASKNAAATSATNAGNSATSATGSASTATTQATAASGSATAASISAATAVTNANTATAKAAEASTSATNAAASKVLAEAAATSLEVIKAGRNQAQFEAIRAQNNELYAASGFVHLGKHQLGSSYTKVNEGLWVSPILPNAFYLGEAGSAQAGDSKTGMPVVNISGVTSYIDNLATRDRGIIKFPQAPDGKTTYNKSTGAVIVHATATAAFNAAAIDANVEVVTDRVDMWGFESFLEEVSATNPWVYPNGLIQSQATTMDGIDTSASARPVTYYAVFEGDVGSKGKGVNFFTATDANKKKLLANHKNKLYYLDDGRLVQWRLRQRTIAGAGNGDWVNIDTTNPSNFNMLSFGDKYIVKTHGAQDVAKPNNASADGYQFHNPTAVNWLDGSGLGIWSRHKSVSTQSMNGELYFLVCGTVNRLNQGAYHPSFNPSGAKFWANTTTGGGAYWYLSAAGNNNVSTALCFNQVNGSVTGIVGARNQSGYIGDSAGRPDNRFFDAIYAEGQGGVCRDMRYSANGLTPTDFAEADQKVKSGAYRGFEKLSFSKAGFTVKPTQAPTFKSGRTLIYIDNSLAFFGGTPGINDVGAFISNGTGRYLVDIYNSNPMGNYVYINSRYGDVTAHFPVNSQVVLEKRHTFSVGGSFLQTDVAGDPANILLTDGLKDGWQGSWIPQILKGEGPKTLPFSRKAEVGVCSIKHTNTMGSVWTAQTVTAGGATNTIPVYVDKHEDYIWIFQYQAYAEQTENAVNAPVYGGRAGVGAVWESCEHDVLYGGLLTESLISKIATSGGAQPKGGYLNVNYLGVFKPTGELLSAVGYEGGHVPVNLGAPTNNSPAVKALNYNVNISQQGFIQYAYTELKHNGTSWGDDSKVSIVDNQSTKVDLNGTTVLVGTAKLKEPLGWIKNKI